MKYTAGNGKPCLLSSIGPGHILQTNMEYIPKML